MFLSLFLSDVIFCLEKKANGQIGLACIFILSASFGGNECGSADRPRNYSMSFVKCKNRSSASAQLIGELSEARNNIVLHAECGVCRLPDAICFFVAAHRSAISCNKCYVAATLLRLVQLVLRDKVVRNKKDTQGGKHRSP